MKVFFPRELLANEARTLDGAFGVQDKTAIRLVVEKDLPNSEHD